MKTTLYRMLFICSLCLSIIDWNVGKCQISTNNGIDTTNTCSVHQVNSIGFEKNVDYINDSTIYFSIPLWKEFCKEFYPSIQKMQNVSTRNFSCFKAKHLFQFSNLKLIDSTNCHYSAVLDINNLKFSAPLRMKNVEVVIRDNIFAFYFQTLSTDWYFFLCSGHFIYLLSSNEAINSIASKSYIKRHFFYRKLVPFQAKMINILPSSQ